jgi:hypothetical protein
VKNYVGVAVVAGVLLDHVQVEPADVASALRVVTMAGHDAIELSAGHGDAGLLYFLFECLVLAAASMSSTASKSWPVWSRSCGKGRSVSAA